MSFFCVDFVSFGSLSRDTREDNNCSLCRASKAQDTLAIFVVSDCDFCRQRQKLQFYGKS